MEFGAIEQHAAQNGKFTSRSTVEEKDAKVSFKNELVSKINQNAGVVQAAEKAHEQTFLKKKKQKKDKKNKKKTIKKFKKYLKKNILCQKVNQYIS
jgi:hypothetical protein